MYKRHDGLTEDHRLQNQFTAYLRSAVHNGRIDYLRGKDKPQRIEIMLEDMDYLMAEESDFLLQLAEYEALRQALQEIKEQERYILLARVIDEKGFAEIADEVGLSYKGTAAVYYRTLEKLRKLLRGEENEFERTAHIGESKSPAGDGNAALHVPAASDERSSGQRYI